MEEENGERLELEEDEAAYKHEEDTVVDYDVVDYDEKYVENEIQENYVDGEGEEGDIIEEKIRAQGGLSYLKTFMISLQLKVGNSVL